MSIMSQDPTDSRSWKPAGRSAPVRLFLSGAEGDTAALAGASAAGFPIELNLVAGDGTISGRDIDGAAVAVIQVSPGDKSAMEGFAKLAANSTVPLIAAAFDPPLAFVRALIRAGAHDVVPLPLELEELETSLQPIRTQYEADQRRQHSGHNRLVSIIKSEGGVGATALMGQMATRLAETEAANGREVCLIDFDVQFGDAAFQLGLRPKLTLADLIEAGSRVDGELLRNTSAAHPSGLRIIAAPPEIMPLEALSADRALALVELAMREFGTVFVDIPTNWTNWSLSLLARSDLVLMITELSIASLNRARRQLDLIANQDLGNLDVRVIVNRFEKGLFKKVTADDVERVLGRSVAYTVANDHATMSAAIERGVPIADIRRKSPLQRDLDTIDAGIAAALGLER